MSIDKTPDLAALVREWAEAHEAHLKAVDHYRAITNMGRDSDLRVWLESVRRQTEASARAINAELKMLAAAGHKPKENIA